MTKFDRKEFEHLQKLCKLHCTPDEEEGVLHSLQNVLAYLRQLEAIDTEGVPPCKSVLRSILQNPLREDEIKDLLPREQFLAEVPEHIGGMVRVPPVLKAQ